MKLRVNNVSNWTAALALGLALTLLAPALGHARGMLTYTFDDGLESVYTQGYPVLKQYGQVATVGLIASFINTADPAFMSIEQARELQDNGWELASHGMTHQRPADIPLYYSDEILTDWHAVPNQKSIYQIHYKFQNVSILLENDVELMETTSFAAMQKTRGSYYLNEVIDQLYIHPYSDKPVDSLELRTGSYQRELEYSENELKGYGFNVTNYISPYNFWNADTEKLSKRYYQCVASANNSQHTNFSTNFDKFSLTRFIMHSDTPPEQIIKMLEEDVVKRDGWVILCLHGVEDNVGYESWPANKLEAVAKWVNENGIKVVNLREGWQSLETVRQMAEKVDANKPAVPAKALTMPAATIGTTKPGKQGMIQ